MTEQPYSVSTLLTSVGEEVRNALNRACLTNSYLDYRIQRDHHHVVRNTKNSYILELGMCGPSQTTKPAIDLKDELPSFPEG